MVEGGKRSEHDLANQILQQARQSQGRDPEEEDIDDGKGKDVAFTGSAHTLSGNVIKEKGTKEVQRGTPKKRTITFWEDGFTIDYQEGDGRERSELMAYDDPKNRALLQAIQEGKAPLRELRLTKNEPVNVQVIHKMHEKYARGVGEEMPRTFTGTARTLNENAAPVGKKTAQVIKEEPREEQPVIDSSLPTVNHQLRFQDGRRVNTTFNTNSSINSVFDYARKVSNAKKIRILAGHPPTEVHEGEGTLESRGLGKGSVLTIRPIQ